MSRLPVGSVLPHSHVCSECIRRFPTQEALGGHLLWHNHHRAFLRHAAVVHSMNGTRELFDTENDDHNNPSAGFIRRSSASMKSLVLRQPFKRRAKAQARAEARAEAKEAKATAKAEARAEAKEAKATAKAAAKAERKARAITKAQARARAKQTHLTTTPPALVLTALTRAMRMVVLPPQARNAVKRTATTRTESVGLTPEKYQTMLKNLASPSGGAFYVPAAVAMLAQTQPFKAESIAAMDDLDVQVVMLLNQLQNELYLAFRRFHPERRASVDGDRLTGWAEDPSRSSLAEQCQEEAAPEPEPTLEPVETMFCGICMDDDPLEDIFFVTGCDHAYCRESIHTYVLGRIDEQDVMPKCPHDGCNNVISDGDLTMVLTVEEQQRYYKTCLDLAIANEPGLFQCLQPGCHGVGALSQDSTHFVCPVCCAERCVQCNTRDWHAGLTCGQYRRRQQENNELHPEQLRQIYGNSNVYQCGRCAFGPIEHAYCSNLATHQNEAVGNARINNCCPRCQWFASDISEWPRWNGQLHASVSSTHA